MLRMFASTAAPVDLSHVTDLAVAAHAVAEQAMKAAAVADGKGDNARQMVLNRDPAAKATADQAAATAAQVTSLEQIAATVQQLNGASVADRQALHAQLNALAATVAALPRSSYVSAGKAQTTAALALGASVDLTVTLDRPMPSADYRVLPLPTSAALLSTGAVLTVKAQTATTVTVTVKALVAVAASSVVQVLAWT